MEIPQIDKTCISYIIVVTIKLLENYMKNLLIILLLFFSVTCLFSQNFGKMRREMDAAFQDYMYTLGREGFYHPDAQKKLEKFEILKAKVEKATSQVEVNTESATNKKSQSWIRKIINNFKTTYYKKKAIKLGKKINKAIANNPKQSQTGPAKRKDINVINEHLKLLEKDNDYQKIYGLLSEAIIKDFN